MQLLLFYINLVPINPTPCISNLLNLNFKSFLCPAKIDVMAKTSTITVDLGNIFNICCLVTHNAGKIAVRRYHFKNLNVSFFQFVPPINVPKLKVNIPPVRKVLRIKTN